MRFHISVFDAISGNATKVEVIGDEVNMPGTEERFAIHRSHMADDDDERYVVTHIDTGFRLSAADEIHEAIEAAKARLAKKGVDALEKAIAKARKILADKSAA